MLKFKFAIALAMLLCATTVATAVHLPGIPDVFTQTDEVLSAIADDVAHKFETEYMKFVKTGIESAVLRELSQELAQMHSKKDIFIKELWELNLADQLFVCTTCRATVNVVARMFREEDGELNGPNNEEIAKKLTLDICRRLNMQTPEVCGGLFDSNWPTISYIIQNTDEMDSRTFCSLFMEYGFCNVQSTNYNWTMSVDASKLPITAPKNEKPLKTDNDVYVLHITDIHFDPLYEPGALAECDEPLCCQRHKSEAEGTSKAAGYWGDYRECDAPWHMIENALQHVKATHPKIDYIYLTGDDVDHMVWATSVQKNKDVITKISNKFDELFPNAKAFHSIGNHEPHPLNVFSPEDAPNNINTKWMYEHMAATWNSLTADAKTSIVKGGYYTISVTPSFRIISLNNNDCYDMNWWLFYAGTNKQTQLQFLHDTLLEAERSNQKVHILMHIPTADGGCWSVWARECNRIIERFSGTISGIFNGHSHKDEMHVHYSANGHAIGLSWNAGSLTPFTFKNPNYRVYRMNPTTMEVVDHETWLFHLDEANELGELLDPEWIKEYDFTTEFTDDLSPAGIDALLEKMAEQPNLLRKFWQYKHTMATPRLASGCGRSCLMSTLCRLATSVNDQKTRCNELTAKLGIALDNESTTASPTGPTATPTGPTATPTETTPGPDGAASIVALRITTIMGIWLLIKYLF